METKVIVQEFLVVLNADNFAKTSTYLDNPRFVEIMDTRYAPENSHIKTFKTRSDPRQLLAHS